MKISRSEKGGRYFFVWEGETNEGGVVGASREEELMVTVVTESKEGGAGTKQEMTRAGDELEDLGFGSDDFEVTGRGLETGL